MSGYLLRKHPRFRVNLPARFRALDSFAWQSASLVNLSEGGMCLYSRNEVPRSQEIEIEVKTIDREGRQQRRRMIARVMWRRGQRYGVRFTAGDRRYKLRR